MRVRINILLNISMGYYENKYTTQLTNTKPVTKTFSCTTMPDQMTILAVGALIALVLYMNSKAEPKKAMDL